ncbi:MAG: ABC transporter substrate-binding protein, partial [Gammaproteobacteria bacterium]
DKNVLPLILEQSWYRRFVVISNSLAHAKLGALIAVYPDNERLGQHLAERALRSIAEPGLPKPDIEPLREVKRAINKRFADHFGIDLQGDLRTYFDTVFKSDHAD